MVGIGICCFVEHSSTGSQDYIKRGVYGMPAFDSATIRVDAGGNVLAAVSAKSTGQSHDSVFATLVAQEIGVPYESVKILEGDTDATPFGAGTGVSRSAVSTGGAIRLAAADIRRKATEIARFFLETENEELQISDGQIFDPAVPARTVSFAAVAAAAHDASRIVSLPDNVERGLQATRTFDPPHQTFGHGAHLAVTRVDPETEWSTWSSTSAWRIAAPSSTTSSSMGRWWAQWRPESATPCTRNWCTTAAANF